MVRIDHRLVILFTLYNLGDFQRARACKANHVTATVSIMEPICYRRFSVDLRISKDKSM